MTLEQAIADLDKDVTGILRANNIKGFRRKSCQCPVAKYLQSVTGKWDISVTCRYAACNEIYYYFPPNITTFVVDFDNQKLEEFEETQP